MKTMNIKKGFTVMEIAIAIAILLVILVIVLFSFSTLKNKEILKMNSAQVVSLLEQARSQSVAAKNDSVYGVHIQADKAVLFSGLTYNSSASDNYVYTFDDGLVLATSTFLGGDTIFKKITGNTLNDVTATITLKLASDVSQSVSIGVSNVGVISQP